jgi:hypothetical protein
MLLSPLAVPVVLLVLVRKLLQVQVGAQRLHEVEHQVLSVREALYVLGMSHMTEQLWTEIREIR